MAAQKQLVVCGFPRFGIGGKVRWMFVRGEVNDRWESALEVVVVTLPGVQLLIVVARRREVAEVHWLALSFA